MSNFDTDTYTEGRQTYFGGATADTDNSTTECVSQQELAAVKAEIESKVDQLHSHVHYWQNVTVNILKDHCSPLTSGIYQYAVYCESASLLLSISRSS